MRSRLRLASRGRRYGMLVPSALLGPRPMRWFRSNGSGVAWLAIFALACQFVLTFGHIHTGSVGVISAALAVRPIARWCGRCSSFACAETPTGLAQDFCALSNQIALGQRIGPAGLACDCSANFIHPQIAMAMAGDRISPRVTIFISTPAVLPTPDLPA